MSKQKKTSDNVIPFQPKDEKGSTLSQETREALEYVDKNYILIPTTPEEKHEAEERSRVQEAERAERAKRYEVERQEMLNLWKERGVENLMDLISWHRCDNGEHIYPILEMAADLLSRFRDGSVGDINQEDQREIYARGVGCAIGHVVKYMRVRDNEEDDVYINHLPGEESKEEKANG